MPAYFIFCSLFSIFCRLGLLIDVLHLNPETHSNSILITASEKLSRIAQSGRFCFEVIRQWHGTNPYTSFQITSVWGDLLEIKPTIQCVLDKWVEFTNRNPMKFSHDRYKLTCLGQTTALQQHRMGPDCLGHSSAEKDQESWWSH